MKLKYTIFSVILILMSSCNNKSNSVRTYYGTNKYYLAVRIIEKEKAPTINELKDISIKAYEGYDEKLDRIPTLINCRNKPYAIIYNYRRFKNEVSDTVILYKDFKRKYERLINEFEELKQETVIKNHTIENYYASLGTNGHMYDGGYLSILSKDNNNSYFLSIYSCKECSDIRADSLEKTNVGFERLYQTYDNYNGVYKSSKDIFYKDSENFIVKELQYTAENEEKYTNYLIKLD